METEFKSLSWPLKVGIVGGWISIIMNLLAFMIGFFGGI